MMREIVKLESLKLIRIERERVELLSLGARIIHTLQARNAAPVRTTSPKVAASQQRRCERSNLLLELYKQGKSCQQIADLYGIHRSRVNQILARNPAYHDYLAERQLTSERAKLAAQLERQEGARRKLAAIGLAALYPVQVAQFWDRERNGDLQPEGVSSRSPQRVWFKCTNNHSWQAKPIDIIVSWGKRGTSGCPTCAGRRHQPRKQPAVSEVYLELVARYWDEAENARFNFDPTKLTLGSNRWVCFKCPLDGHQWRSPLYLTIRQQWAKGNAGCQVCNGTLDRPRRK